MPVGVYSRRFVVQTSEERFALSPAERAATPVGSIRMTPTGGVALATRIIHFFSKDGALALGTGPCDRDRVVVPSVLPENRRSFRRAVAQARALQ